jgi:hypothetical protein
LRDIVCDWGRHGGIRPEGADLPRDVSVSGHFAPDVRPPMLAKFVPQLKPKADCDPGPADWLVGGKTAGTPCRFVSEITRVRD